MAATIASMAGKLLLIPWLVAVVYSSIPLFWFAVHPFADRWRRMRLSPYRALLPLWAIILFALGAGTWPWHGIRLYAHGWTWLPAMVFFAAGARAYRGIRSQFGVRRFTGEAEIRAAEHEQQLVSSGMHAHMRHPIYFAHLCMLAGWATGSGLLINFILLGVALSITFPLMISMEERELEQRLGDGYRSYRKAVPLFPRGWRTYTYRLGEHENAQGR